MVESVNRVSGIEMQTDMTVISKCCCCSSSRRIRTENWLIRGNYELSLNRREKQKNPVDKHFVTFIEK